MTAQLHRIIALLFVAVPSGVLRSTPLQNPTPFRAETDLVSWSRPRSLIVMAKP